MFFFSVQKIMTFALSLSLYRSLSLFPLLILFLEATAVGREREREGERERERSAFHSGRGKKGSVRSVEALKAEFNNI